MLGLRFKAVALITKLVFHRNILKRSLVSIDAKSPALNYLFLYQYINIFGIRIIPFASTIPMKTCSVETFFPSTEHCD